MDFASKVEETSRFDSSHLIVFTFIGLIALLLAYLYYANKALIDSGLHHNKKYGKKSKKGKTNWSYGD